MGLCRNILLKRNSRGKGPEGAWGGEVRTCREGQVCWEGESGGRVTPESGQVPGGVPHTSKAMLSALIYSHKAKEASTWL